MKDPERLLSGGATSLERELLSSVMDEPVPAELSARMVSALGFDQAALLAEPPLGAAGGGAAAPALAPSLSGLKVLVGAVGLGSALTMGWLFTKPAPSTRTLETAPQNVAAPPSAAAEAPQPLTGSNGVKQFGESPVNAPVTPDAQQTQDNRATSERSAAAAHRVSDERRGAAAVNGTVTSGTVTSGTVRSGVSRSGISPSPASASRVSVGRDGQPARQAIALPNEPAVADPAVQPLPPSATDLSAELRWLDPARSAINQGDFVRGEALLDGYQQQFPRGALLREAKKLRALAAQVRASSGSVP
jgi:hypothetical protein